MLLHDQLSSVYPSQLMFQCVSTSVSDPQLVEVVGWNEDVYLNKVFFHSKDIADTVIFILSAPPNVQVPIYTSLA